MNELSLADVAAIRGNNDGNGWGNGDGWWIILLFILLGGWGNRGWGNGGNGSNGAGGDVLYPWLNQSEQISNGFANAATQLCNCCADMQMAVASGFANAETAANARQMANMQTQFGMQTAMQQGFTGVQAQTAQLASDIQLGNAQQTATILAENCADRAALSDGVRDIIQANQSNTQSILDKLCQLELDGYKRENSQLQAQLNAANLAASQAAQNQLITQGFANEVDALYNRLNTCPVPSMPVYGRTPIFTCQPQNQGCGCGCGSM